MATIRQRGTGFTVTWREDGKQRGATFRSLSQANIAKAQVEAGLPIHTQPKEATELSKRPRTVADYAQTFLAGHGYAPASLPVRRSIFKHWVNPKFGARRMDSITPAEVRRWLRELEAKASERSHDQEHQGHSVCDVD